MTSPNNSLPSAITSIGVKGFKSIRDLQTIAIAPLTVLAGANSSGKSSVIQPLLLMKQTIEAPYDPGPLLIKGPYASFTSVDQFLFNGGLGSRESGFEVEIRLDNDEVVGCRFNAIDQKGVYPIELEWTRYHVSNDTLRLWLDMEAGEIRSQLEHSRGGYKRQLEIESKRENVEPGAQRNRCFIEPHIYYKDPNSGFKSAESGWIPTARLIMIELDTLMYLPAERGGPKRTFELRYLPKVIGGLFHDYTASVIFQWGIAEPKGERYLQLQHDLAELGLTGSIEASLINPVELELRVGRQPVRAKPVKPLKNGSPKRRGSRNKENELVNLADVGVGVSYALPVVTALIAAMPNQLVYIDQPELHLHPRAQVAMASLLAKAAKRGVRVIVETHSAMLVLAIRALVAEKVLSPDQVKLHWFQRDDDGATNVTTAELDEFGRQGDWPGDFSDVALETQGRYLDSVQPIFQSKPKSKPTVASRLS